MYSEKKKLNNARKWQLLESAFLKLPVGVVLFDAEGNLMISNAHYDEMLEIINRDGSCNLLNSPEIPDTIKHHLATDDEYVFQMTFDADGHVVTDILAGTTIQSRVSRIYDAEKNELLGYVTVTENITDSLTNKQRLERLVKKHHTNVIELRQKNRELKDLMHQKRLVLDNIHEGLIFLTPDNVVRWKNNLRNIYGDRERHMYVVGTHCYEHFGLSQPCTECPVAWAKRDGHSILHTYHDPNGMALDVFATPVLGEDGEVDGYLMRLNVVTEREEMIKDLREAKEKAEESERLKAIFLQNMSHEIRTPLNAIVGFNEVLNGEAGAALSPEERAEFTRIITDNVELISTLVNDILELSKLETGNYKAIIDQVEVMDLCNACALSIAHRVAQGVELKVDVPQDLSQLMAETDGQRVRQLLTNYLTNACKYTARGSITLAVRPVTLDGVKSVRFSVTDTGTGIPPEYAEDVFDRFTKLDNFKQGTGLGLNICRLIADLLHGRVYVDTSYTDGACFVFDLPLKYVASHLTSPFHENLLSVEDVKI